MNNTYKFKNVDENKIIDYVFKILGLQPSLISNLVLQIIKTNNLLIATRLLKNECANNDIINNLKSHFAKLSFESKTLDMLMVIIENIKDNDTDIQIAALMWSDSINNFYEIIKKVECLNEIQVLKPLLFELKKKLAEYMSRNVIYNHELFLELYLCDYVDFASEFSDKYIEKIVNHIFSLKCRKNVLHNFSNFVEKSKFDLKSHMIKFKYKCGRQFYAYINKNADSFKLFDKDILLNMAVVNSNFGYIFSLINNSTSESSDLLHLFEINNNIICDILDNYYHFLKNKKNRERYEKNGGYKLLLKMKNSNLNITEIFNAQTEKIRCFIKDRRYYTNNLFMDTLKNVGLDDINPSEKPKKFKPVESESCPISGTPFSEISEIVACSVCRQMFGKEYFYEALKYSNRCPMCLKHDPIVYDIKN